MRHLMNWLAAWLLALSLPFAAAAAEPLPLIPYPAHVSVHAGHFPLAAVTPIRVATGDAAAANAARFLVQSVRAVRGPALRITTTTGTDPAIEFASDAEAPAAKGSYTLDITPARVRIAARSAAGLVHGAATLFQLMTGEAAATSLPALHIEDQPRFGWRGILLDSVRHMQTLPEIRVLLDQMALHKLNVLHWHLTDDQGWRIEIKRYPELTRIGAWRTPPDAGHDGEPGRYGGFYTQAEIRGIVAYAAARGITVVPEIDLPGHATAAIAAYPELGVTGQPLAVSVDWGVLPNLYNVKDSTFRFLENVLDEVMALFPSKIIHLGGDEAVKDQWIASEAVQARMHALGIDTEDRLQGWFMGRLADYLARHGRRMIGWDEILGGKLPASAVVMSWRGTQGADQATKLGHDVVLSPSPQLYFDSLQSARQDETTGRVPVQSLADVYAFEPIGKDMTPTQAGHVLGAQANLWAEHMPSFRHIEHALFPRLDALSEAQWSPRASRPFADFLVRLQAQLARYRAVGIQYADTAFAPDITLDRATALASGKATVSLSNQTDFGTLRYTTNGSEPGIAARVYRGPFTVSLPTTVRVAAYDADNRLLAAPRQRVIDRAQLMTRVSGELVNCPGSEFRLRVQPLPDATSMAPVYTLPLFNDCQQWLKAPLDGIASLQLDVARLYDNYALAHEAKLVVHRATTHTYGDLSVHVDGCDGKVLAVLPLPNPATSARNFRLEVPLAEQGQHDLCMAFAVPKGGALYVFATARLLPAATQ